MIVLRAVRRQYASAAVAARARVQRRLRFVDEDEIEPRRPARRNPARARSDGFQPKSHDVVDAARAQPLDDARSSARSRAGRRRGGRAARRWRRDRRRQPRLEPSLTPLKVTKLRSRVVDSATVTACASPRRFRLTTRTRSRAQAAHASRAEGADDAGPQPEPRRGRRR